MDTARASKIQVAYRSMKYELDFLINLSFLKLRTSLIIFNNSVLKIFIVDILDTILKQYTTCVDIASSKNKEGFEGFVNLRQLCKTETQLRVCITVKNSPNP